MENVIYGLFQTDVWKSTSSYVNFGFFETVEEAVEEGLAHNLLKEINDEYNAVDDDSIVVIQEFELGKYGENNGSEVESFEYAEGEDE